MGWVPRDHPTGQIPLLRWGFWGEGVGEDANLTLQFFPTLSQLPFLPTLTVVPGPGLQFWKWEAGIILKEETV